MLMSRRLPISALHDMTQCRPTESEAFRRAADQYQRRRLTPGQYTLTLTIRNGPRLTQLLTQN